MIQRLAALACAAMFAAVFAAFVAKIAARYLLGDALAWADEISVILFIWIIFIANGFLLRESDQIRFDLLVRHAPPAAQRGMARARALIIAAIFACALPTVIDYTRFLFRERTPVLQFRLDWLYSCFALFMAAVVVRSLIQVKEGK